MLKFGFELEGFHLEGSIEECNVGPSIRIPPSGLPTDGFPGLLEVRNKRYGALDYMFFELGNELRKIPSMCVSIHEHTFSGMEHRVLRTRATYKEPCEISNIYGKEPKLKGNKTLASFQVNFSNLTREAHTDNQGKKYSDEFDLFDFVPYIRALDKEFSKEIKESNRQPGFYSVKDGCRVEYRSLPNFVFKRDGTLERLAKCFGVNI